MPIPVGPQEDPQISRRRAADKLLGLLGPRIGMQDWTDAKQDERRREAAR